MEVVAAWLAEHGLSDYAANFDEEGYDDMQLLAELSAEETAELGEAVQVSPALSDCNSNEVQWRGTK